MNSKHNNNNDHLSSVFTLLHTLAKMCKSNQNYYLEKHKRSQASIMINSNGISLQYGPMCHFFFLTDAQIYTPCRSRLPNTVIIDTTALRHPRATSVQVTEGEFTGDSEQVSLTQAHVFSSRSFQFGSNGTIQDGSRYTNTNRLYFDPLQDKSINNINRYLH